VAGKLYRVERADNLLSPFSTIVADNVPGTGGTILVTDPGAAAAADERSYRVRLLPAP
jgi:hypothetical protein